MEIQLSPQESLDQNVSFTEVHAQLAPEGDRQDRVEAELKEEVKGEREERGAEGASGVEEDLSAVSEGVSQEYALSSTLLHEKKAEERAAGEEEEEGEQDKEEGP